MRRFLYITFRVIRWGLLVFFASALLAFYVVQLPSIQTILAQKATDWLSERIGAPVTVGSVRVAWFDDITLEDVTIKDLKGRTMISVPEVYVNFKTNFSFNLREKLKYDNNLDYVLLNRPEVTLVREPDGLFNIDYWIDRIRKVAGVKNQALGIPERNVPFTIDEGYVENGTFTLSDPRKERFPTNEFDYYNFTLREISGSVKNFFVLGDTVAFAASELKAVDERSDLRVKELSTDFFYSRQQMLLKNLDASINNSHVRNFLAFYYDTPAAFSDFNSRVRMQAHFINCELDAQDLARFAPELYAYTETYRLNGELAGIVHDFKVDDFRLDFGESSFLKGNVAFKGLPNLRKTVWDFNLVPSVITAEDARQYAGEANYEKYVKQFGRVDFNGTFNGLYNDFKTEAEIRSSGLGEVRGKVKVRLDNQPEKSTYYGDVVTTQLDLGKLLDLPEMLGKVTFDGVLDGKGLTIPSAGLKLEGDVRHIEVNNYKYQNIALRGKMNQSLFEGEIEVYDPNLQAEMSGKINFANRDNEFDIIGVVKESNLRALGLTKDSVALRSDFALDMSGNTLDNWLGEAQLTNIHLANAGRDFRVDSLFFYSSASPNERKIQLASDLFDIDLTGNYIPSQAISDIAGVVKEYALFFNRDQAERDAYYATKPVGFFTDKYLIDYQVRFKDSAPFFAYFYPDVAVSSGSLLRGRFEQGTTASFRLFGQLDSLQIGNNRFYNDKIDFFTAKTTSGSEVQSSWILTSENQRLGKQFLTENLEITGAWGDANLITFDAKIRQQQSANHANVFGKLQLLPEGFEITFNPRNSELLVLDERWQLDKNNRIFIRGNDITFSDLILSHNNQRIGMNGLISEDPTAVVMLNINDFNLRTLRPLTPETDISGVLNADLAIQEVYNKGLISSKIAIDSLQYQSQLIGDIFATTEWDNVIKKLQLRGRVEHETQPIFTVEGTFDPAEAESPLNLSARMVTTPVNIFAGFVKDVFSDLNGTADGNVQITGKLTDPLMNGEIFISGGRLRIDVLNSYLYFSDKILVRNTSFTADEDGIKLWDAPENGNYANLKGGIYSLGEGRFRLGMAAVMPEAAGFQLMNTTIKDNEYFFGRAFAGGDMQISGTFNDVAISGNLSSKRNTKLVIPLDGATSVNTKTEAIPFYNKNNEIVYDLLRDSQDSVAAPPKVNLSGVRLAFNLTLTPAAECEIIFDRTNNDKLTARGNGRLVVDYDTRGGFSINGPYEVESGKYDFSFQNLSSLRKFDIEKGSRIEWSGDPYLAKVNMKTTYITNLSIDPIIGSQSNASTTRYPAKVTVNLTNDLMHPDISFDLAFVENQLPITYRTQIMAFEERLHNDEQLLSRNVSSVLAFNQIMFSGNSVDFQTQQLLLDNISNLVSNQIGNLASQIDPNFEVGLQLGDIRQNFNNTQLNVAYQYNERLKLKGNSFYTNGSLDNVTNNNTQLTLGGEIEYLLTNDGSWRLQVYSRSVPNATYFLTSTTGNVFVSGATVQFARNFNYLFPKAKKLPKGVSGASTEKSEGVSMK